MEKSVEVIVAHPGRQYSHQLAAALFESGLLSEYWTGIPAQRDGVISSLLAIISKYDLVGLPNEKISHFHLAPILTKLSNNLLPPTTATRVARWGDAGFDYWSAYKIGDRHVDAVVCYENAALRTFKRAREAGINTILDAASFHHSWQDKFYDYKESDRFHEKVTRRKDEEIRLSDHILTVSEYARESYVDAGVPPGKVTSVPLGCDLSRFYESEHSRGPNDTFTFLFAGYAGERKGVDLLLESSSALRDQDMAHDVVIAGDADPSIPWNRYNSVIRKGRVPQPQLADLYRQADCFVLPSRHDSFGMVVVEAMATGLPVIVSDHVGAKEAVDEGVNGWVVPAENSEALEARMRWCVEHPQRLSEMQNAARESAENYSWQEYHQRAEKTIRNVIRKDEY